MTARSASGAAGVADVSFTGGFQEVLSQIFPAGYSH
jgi:hypothetical protein